MKVTSVDLNGKVIDWSKTYLPNDLAKQALEVIERSATHKRQTLNDHIHTDDVLLRRSLRTDKD